MATRLCRSNFYQIWREGDSYTYKWKLGNFFYLITCVIESNRKKGSREREKKIYICIYRKRPLISKESAMAGILPDMPETASLFLSISVTKHEKKDESIQELQGPTRV